MMQKKLTGYTFIGGRERQTKVSTVMHNITAGWSARV
jgi:hypothetical protein